MRTCSVAPFVFFVRKNCAIFPYEKTKGALSYEDKVLPFALAQKQEVQKGKRKAEGGRRKGKGRQETKRLEKLFI
jgi:hypothetical protein